MSSQIKLTSLSHGGGCGCKISPAVLTRLMAGLALPVAPPELLVSNETADDAAVYRISADQAVVATTDFFMPIVDVPRDFGAIAATNALSDIYAMGARPIMALALVGMPLEKLSEETIREILAGGAEVCNRIGVPIAGGHSIDTVEPIYGLAALGLIHPNEIKRNVGAIIGDRLILSKPLGIGILAAALRKELLSAAGYNEMIDWTTRLNCTGMKLAKMPGVHAMTDVTGFGLGGHLLEICTASRVTARLELHKLPILGSALELVRAGIATGASARNWSSYGAKIAYSGEEWQQRLITDPQTSGGLLVAVAEDTVDEVLSAFAADGFYSACVIGTCAAENSEYAIEMR